jgi:hypothetical protein
MVVVVTVVVDVIVDVIVDIVFGRIDFLWKLCKDLKHGREKKEDRDT